MRTEQEMANGQYFDYSSQAYAPDSPDTFFAQVNIQPPTSDSNQTPPSPTFSKPRRRSVARPSQAYAASSHQSSASYSAHRASKSTHGPSSQVRRDRERQLANTTREELIRLIVVKEYEYTEAKLLVTSAILQVESLQDRLSREEKSRKTLEEETHIMGLKTTKAILDSQNETMRSKEDIGFYKLQQQNTERQLQHVQERLREVEKERDEADRALVRARTTARQLKEDNVTYKAREEGRREGFEEGLRQGRLQQESLPPEGEGSEAKPRKKERKPPGPVVPTPEQEQALAALREIDDREKLRIRLQLNDIERKLDAERQHSKDLDRENKKLRAEKSKLEQDKQKAEEERDQARRALESIEKENVEIKRREADALKRASSDRRRLTEENERERREIRREKERAEREKHELEEKAREDVQRERERARKAEEDRERDREREREREKEREREQREKDKETSATIAAAAAAAVSAVVGAGTSSHSSPEHVNHPKHDYRSQPYIPMPPPPVGAVPIDMPTPIVMPAPELPFTGTGRNNAGYATVPRVGSSGSQRGYHGHPRRDSFSSAASTTQFDILQRGELSVIPEDASVRAASPSWGGNGTSWYNPSGPAFPAPEVPNIVPRGGPSPGVGPVFPTPEIPSVIPRGVASGGVAFPVPEVPNIVPGGPGGSNVTFPQPEVPNIVPKGGVSGLAGVAFPTPEVPNIVPKGGTSGSGSVSFPTPEVPNIVPKGGYTPGGSIGVQFPQPEVPNIVSKGGQPISGGGGVAFPTPEVPNIVPKGGSGRYTPGGGATFPTPEVPNIIPKGGAGGYTPGGSVTFPNPEVPNIIGRGAGLSTGPSGVVFPTAEIPNIVGKGGPGVTSPSGGGMFPRPEIPNIVRKAGSSQGRHTPAPGGSGVSFPNPEVPNMVAGNRSNTGTGPGLFPIPEIPNIIPKGATSGGIPFPAPEIPNIVPKPGTGSSGSGGFPTPHVPNIIPKGQGGVQFPNPEVPDIVPKGGSQPSVAFPTPVVPNIVPKGKKGKNTARNALSRSETPSVFPEGTGSISRAVEFPNPEVPQIVPPKGISGAFGGSSPGWPSAPIPNHSGGTPGWPTSNISGQGGKPPSPYSNPTFLNVGTAGSLRQIDRLGSRESWELNLQPPSRPASASGPNEQDGSWLSPNHSTMPLPKSQPRGGNNISTKPSTPVVITGALPLGFVPQTLTDANGVSTRLYSPHMEPAPVIPSLSGSNIYKNPVNRDRGESQPSSVFGGVAPVFPHSPAGSMKPLGTPGPAWGTLPSMTPGSTTRDLPGPMSVFGGASPNVVSMPIPTVPNLDEENEDFFDQNTLMNTKLNATIGNNTASKKKKKKR